MYMMPGRLWMDTARQEGAGYGYELCFHAFHVIVMGAPTLYSSTIEYIVLKRVPVGSA